MTNPRKFAEKIALLQQKQAQDDAAFTTILNEVEAAKQKAERGHSSRSTADVPSRKHERNFQPESNGTKTFVEHPNGSDRLLQLPENPSTWRRTHSDSSLHAAMIPQVVANYHARFEQQENPVTFDRFPSDQLMTYEENHQPKFDFPHYQMTPPTAQYSLPTTHFPPPSHYQYDLNNNNSYANGQINSTYPFASAPTTPLPPTMPTGMVPTQHTLLAGRFSGGNPTSNVLMLPPNQHARANGGSLPDLRTGNPYPSPSTMSFPHTSSPLAGPNARFRSTSPHSNGTDIELLSLGPQQQLPSSIGPLKSSPSMRRRHSPIGDVKPSSSPRRQNSPSPDPSALASQLAAVAATTAHRGEPSSPQSQSSYSPQNSPHLISSPVGTEQNSYSPPSLPENQQTQPYHTLPTHFDRINLDANQSATNDSFSSFFDDLSMNFSQPTMLTNPSAQKSPTIPNIILTGVDSCKLELTDDLENLIDPLNYDDFTGTSEDLWKMLDN